MHTDKYIQLEHNKKEYTFGGKTRFKHKNVLSYTSAWHFKSLANLSFKHQGKLVLNTFFISCLSLRRQKYKSSLCQDPKK